MKQIQTHTQRERGGDVIYISPVAEGQDGTGVGDERPFLCLVKSPDTLYTGTTTIHQIA